MMTMVKRTYALLMAALVFALAGCSTTAGQTTGVFIDDSVITAKVKAAIFEQPQLKTFEIGVKTYKGEVQLNGFVNNKEAVPLATAVASKVEGVKSVKNDLIVK
jgi:osmotically-inducible protein OsmY